MAVARYRMICHVPVVLRDMFYFLTEFERQSTNSKEAEIDERLMKFLLQSEESDLIWDLRKNNCRPNDEQLDPFWKEMDKFLQEKCAVHERRQNDRLY